MNCVEFERVLPEYLEGASPSELLAHLSTCPVCAGLLDDLELISSKAKLLLASDEPSPAVWNAIEAQLRREGLIRGPAVSVPAAPWFQRWRSAWMVPVAAALALIVGLKLYHPARVGDTGPVVQVSPAPLPKPLSKEDQQLMSTVSSRTPAQRARYRANLDAANSFIHDAEQFAQQDPSDVYTQQMLMNAYEQKQMLYDLAVDRANGPEVGEQ